MELKEGGKEGEKVGERFKGGIGMGGVKVGRGRG